MKDWLENNISAKVLIAAGLAVIPSFLFQDLVIPKAVQTLVFILSAAAAGKRFRPLPPTIMIVSITLIHLFTPIGKILLTIGGLRITRGALHLGLIKAMTLVGLIYLSRSTVRSDLVLPGRFGRIIGKTFWYFDLINERWSRTKGNKRSLISRVDELLLDIDTGQERTAGREGAVHPGTTPAGYGTVFSFLLFNWGLFALQYVPSFPYTLQ